MIDNQVVVVYVAAILVGIAAVVTVLCEFSYSRGWEEGYLSGIKKSKTTRRR